MSYGASFDVNTPNAAQIAHVSLIRSPSVTHAFDMNQRFQFLNFTAGSGKVTVRRRRTRTSRRPATTCSSSSTRTACRRSARSSARTRHRSRATRRRRRSRSRRRPAGDVSGTINVTANATDNDAVAGVQFKLDGANLGAEDTTRPVLDRRGTRRPRSNGAHTLTAVARDLPANAATSAAVHGDGGELRRRRRGSSPPTASTPAAARRSPTQSGNGNNGTLTNATWAGATAGRFGNALSFNGTNASVSIPDSDSLDLTTGMTIEAWVNPTALGNTWRTVALEGAARLLRLRAVREHRSDTAVPSGNGMIGGVDRDVRGTAAAAAEHVDASRDDLRRQRALRLYVNGVQVGARCRHRLDRRPRPARSRSAATRSGASGSPA